MTNLPPAYRWLKTLAPLPRMVDEALKLYGTAEVAGLGNNPAIIGWAKEMGGDVARLYGADSTPWCGLFVGIVAKRAGKPLPATPLWALSWASWGTQVAKPMLGDVLTFKRPGGGHVGIYVGEDATAFHVLGGNQGDQVSIVRIVRDRLFAARRPSYNVQPATVQRYQLAANGAVSTNEA